MHPKIDQKVLSAIKWMLYNAASRTNYAEFGSDFHRQEFFSVAIRFNTHPTVTAWRCQKK
jgi:hypothetical protein